MTRQTSLCAIAVLGTVLASASPSFADDAIVKIAPTPMPAAGPTVAAAQQFCGEATGTAEELIQRYSTNPALKQVYKSDQYVAYSDSETASTVMYTFTVKGHPAFPAAVCRRPVQEGDNLVIKMSVVCDGAADACTKLKNDFNVMTAKMQAQADSELAAKKK